ncbi:MAG: nucleoside hydrolase [Solobacterium sp.]|nr:nucleoside hydrolase [Solobacterium sp.]
MTEKYIIMDVDTGVDDSMALMLAGACKDLHILALTCTYGNNEVEKTTRNTQKIAELLGIDAPVAMGAVRPMIDPPMDFSGGLGPMIHGLDGLGNVGDRLPEPVHPVSELKAPDLMAEVIRKAPEMVTIVATGPLTNVAAFLLSWPELADKVELIALMGGAAYGGNLAFTVEANIGHDPEAAAVVFHSSIPKVVFGLDATMGVYITDEERAAMAEKSAVGAFMKDCLQPYADTYRQLANWPGAVLHDSLPVAWLIDPDTVTLKPVVIDIELNGRLNRGATVCDFNSNHTADTNTLIARQADREKIIALHLEAAGHYQ